MEFVQFHPTGMVWPPGVRGLLVTEAVRGEGGLLTNAEGERFMQRYDPERLELSTRDIVARAIYTEVAEGRGSPRGGVFLDVSHLPADAVRKKLPSMFHQFEELAGVDITRTPMEVGPTCHYIMGGVKVDAETAKSRVVGLFAAGECAGGLSGATRLGGNSLSDLLVFGRRAGEAAAEYARGGKGGAVDDGDLDAGAAELERFLATDEDPYALHAELQHLMQTNVGIYRDEAGLTAAVAGIERLKARVRAVGGGSGTQRAFNPGWHLWMDLRSMLVCAEAIARAALRRHESRGAHSRLDFPEPSPEWGRRSLVSRKDGDEMAIDEQPVVTVDDLEPVLAERRAKDGM
jgi:succinate dehydrogenase / fumarate reductase flavoprotein subunit